MNPTHKQKLEEITVRTLMRSDVTAMEAIPIIATKFARYAVITHTKETSTEHERFNALLINQAEKWLKENLD